MSDTNYVNYIMHCQLTGLWETNICPPYATI